MDISLLLNILSIIVTVISIIIGTKQMGVSIPFWLIWIVVIIELIIILLLHIQRKKLGLSIPKDNDIADFHIYKLFWKSQVIEKDYSNRKDLERGILHVFGNDIEKCQILLLEFLLKSEKSKVIYATDLTTNPKILLTRREYHEKNRIFIEKNNTIKRVLIIDDAKVNDMSFINDLYLVIMLNIKIGVHIKIITTNYLNPEQIRDFIIYDNSVAIIEGHQATEHYTRGDSQIWFLKSKIISLKKVYEDIFEKAELYNQCDKFLKNCDVINGKVINFKSDTFL